VKTIGKLILMLVLILPLMVGGLSVRAASEEDIEASIEAGLAWLAAQQQPDGSWGEPGWSAEGATGLAVLKFEDRAIELGLDPFDPAYPYHQQVEAGLNYLFLGTQTAGGFVWISVSSGYDNYNTGIAMMALAASRNPARIVPPLGSPVDGWTHKQVLQGMLDWMEDAQNDGTPGCECDLGGWGYQANSVCGSDQSNSGYSTLGIGYAISPDYGFGLTVDPNVLAKLETFIENVQEPDGGSDYTACGPWNSSNILRTGNLLYEMALVHRPLADATVQAAIAYIENNWPGWMGDSQGTFTMMKGLVAYQIETLTVGGMEIDWFDEVSTYIVDSQNSDGSWTMNWGLHLDTAWNLLALEKVVALPGCPESPLAPSSVEAILFPGESLEVGKCVETPEIPPKPDIYFLTDSTGSMGPVIAAIQGDADAILAAVDASTTDPRYGAGDYKDFPPNASPPSPYAFNNAAPIPAADDDGAAALAAIGAWAAGGGGDGPEGQFYAQDQIASGAAAFRPDSVPIVVWFGDAPAHDPVCSAISGLGYDIDETSATTKLTTAGINVVAISVVTAAGAFYPAALDDDPTAYAGDYLPICGGENGAAGQATRIATATGGVHLTSVSPEDIADAILEGLQAVSVEVAMHSHCEPPISVSFDPPSQTVVSGSIVTFTETISVAANAPGGTYECDDHVTIDGEHLLDPATGEPVAEHKVIKVPEGFLTGGGQIDNGKGENAEKISFGGNVGFLADFSLVGQWQTNFHNVAGIDLDGARFHSTAITSLQFFRDGGAGPNPPPANANVGSFSATGRLNGVDGYTLHVCLADRGEPGRNNDSIRLRLVSPGGALVYDSRSEFASQDNTLAGVCVARHKLDAGNLQIHSGVKQ